MVPKLSYRYWAAFHYAPEGVSVRFPDLPGCLTSGDTAEQALEEAKEALGGFLFAMEEDHEAIPEPSPLDAIIAALEDGEAACDVQVYMPPIRELMGRLDNKAVKKTLTIPKWLNDAAEEQNLNFSQELQDALKQRLGMSGRR